MPNHPKEKNETYEKRSYFNKPPTSLKSTSPGFRPFEEPVLLFPPLPLPSPFPSLSLLPVLLSVILPPPILVLLSWPAAPIVTVLISNACPGVVLEIGEYLVSIVVTAIPVVLSFSLLACSSGNPQFELLTFVEVEWIGGAPKAVVETAFVTCGVGEVVDFAEDLVVDLEVAERWSGGRSALSLGEKEE